MFDTMTATNPDTKSGRALLRCGWLTLFAWLACLAEPSSAATQVPAPRPLVRHVAPGEDWAISEHMSGTGSWGQDDREMTAILENTLTRGTRFGWDFVNAGNRHAADDFQLYDEHWHSQTLDIIDGDNWPKWLQKIGVKPFVPQPR